MNHNFYPPLKGFLLSCSYSSTIGGLGSLVGTAPNILLKGYFDEHYSSTGLNFLSFSLFALPVSIILILVSWIWLSFRWLPREYSTILFLNLFLFLAKFSDFKQRYLFGSKVKNSVSKNEDFLNSLIKEKYKNLGPTT